MIILEIYPIKYRERERLKAENNPENKKKQRISRSCSSPCKTTLSYKKGRCKIQPLYFLEFSTQYPSSSAHPSNCIYPFDIQSNIAKSYSTYITY